MQQMITNQQGIRRWANDYAGGGGRALDRPEGKGGIWKVGKEASLMWNVIFRS